MRMILNRLALIVALATVSIASGGCQSGGLLDKIATGTKRVYQAATTATVDPSFVVVVVNGFNALEKSATNYLKLHRCPVNTPVCRDPSATQPIKKAFQTGRGPRDALQTFLEQHPGQLGDKGLYDALTTAIDQLEQIGSKYGFGG